MTYSGRHSPSRELEPDGGGHSLAAWTLTATGLGVTFGTNVALRDVSITLRPTDLVAVTGPSGAGKTTLLAALAGRLALTAGRIERPEVDLVVISQEHLLAEVLTALENVATPLLVSGWGRADARRRALDTMAALGVDDAADQLIDELSGGQQQRVSVARGLVRASAVLLADEPTSQLDSTNRNVVLGLLRSHADRGAAVLVATNDPAAADLCDAELHLDAGNPTWTRDDR